ncbi:MAG: hypothetical protein LBG81_07860 [Coriobacteriaceae bacterium]|jgi:hypothetical protein|nr:hypothetical protein [Coriobacteriaceae bacterium]
MVDLKDKDGHRLGDWQRKDLRGDANDLLEAPGAKQWYQQTFWVIVLLLVFWPLGIYLCWKGDWPRFAKVIATVAVAACIAGMLWVRSTLA